MISVVIPLYNKEKSILSTVQSVLKQTYPDFELIIVNDGSTDNSLKVVKTIEDERVKIVDKENGGVSSARNAGILASGNNYIAFLDGDDLWCEYHLETIVDLISSYPSSEVAGYGTRFYKSGGSGQGGYIKRDKHYLLENYFASQATPRPLFNSSSFAIRKDILAETGLFNERLSYGEDVEFWYRVFRKYKLAMSESITSTYQLQAENRSVHRIMPIHKRFHEFDYKNASKQEVAYLDKLVALLVLDYSMQRDYKTVAQILKMYVDRIPFFPTYYLQLMLKKIKKEKV
ncbi:MAG: glycosyltransferase family 2 protein [Tannerellaceae bacterium]|nr:glycosyltransferase family 2 protein [Tannerellaceae bacterium]